eukprot:NODE_55_length_26219_cov_0.194908.p10 type:complete len:252 gc:universal NODE_55_length_26219_cov_0.194908:25625-24870(-)
MDNPLHCETFKHSITELSVKYCTITSCDILKQPLIANLFKCTSLSLICSSELLVIRFPQKLTSNVSSLTNFIIESMDFSVKPQTNDTDNNFKFGHDSHIIEIVASVKNEQSLKARYSSSKACPSKFLYPTSVIVVHLCRFNFFKFVNKNGSLYKSLFKLLQYDRIISSVCVLSSNATIPLESILRQLLKSIDLNFGQPSDKIDSPWLDISQQLCRLRISKFGQLLAIKAKPTLVILKHPRRFMQRMLYFLN